jgi:Fic family protein
MNYISVNQIAKLWKVSPRTVRNYCAHGKIKGTFITGKTWNIPSNATKPIKDLTTNLCKRLKFERDNKIKNGIYHKIIIELTFNSNKIEGSKLTQEETRYIYETNTISNQGASINIDDIMETVNHFKCFTYILDKSNYRLSEKLIKDLHKMLKENTSDSKKDWFAVGDYKKLINEVGGKETTKPHEVSNQMKELLNNYNKIEKVNFEDIIAFHYNFEIIHPFQDGNGRIGRLIMFKECLKNNIVPFIVQDQLKEFYYRGLLNWKSEKEYLMDTCLNAQDDFKKYLDYFGIKY